MLMIFVVLLRENNFDNFVENVDFYANKFFWIEMYKNWCFQKSVS